MLLLRPLVNAWGYSVSMPDFFRCLALFRVQTGMQSVLDHIRPYMDHEETPGNFPWKAEKRGGLDLDLTEEQRDICRLPIAFAYEQRGPDPRKISRCSHSLPGLNFIA